MPSILESTTPVLSQLGATIGRGVTPAPGVPGAANGTYQPIDYTDVFNNIQQQQQQQADREYQLNRDKLDQDYKTAKLNAKTARERNEIDKWYNQQQVKIAQDRLAFEQDSFNKTHGLNQAKLGADLVGTLANLSGPANYFKAADYARGISSMPQTAGFLSALRDNTGLTAFGQQGGIPEAESYGSLLGKLGGGNGAGGTLADTGAAGWTPDGNNLATIAGIGARGAHKLGAGSLESLTDTERKLFTAGLGEAGLDANTFLDQYARSRIGNSGNYQAA